MSKEGDSSGAEDGFDRTIRSFLDGNFPEGPTEPNIDPDEGSSGGQPPSPGGEPPSGWGGWGKDGPWRGPGRGPRPRKPGPKDPGLRRELEKELVRS